MAVTLQGLSPRVQDLHKQVKDFINEHVVPLEGLRKQRLESGANRWEVMPEVEQVKVHSALFRFSFSYGISVNKTKL